MDPVKLILTALAAGAAAGTGDDASAVTDACAGLKEKVKVRLAGRGDGGQMLARYEEAPQRWDGQLGAELAEVGADRDEGVLTAAQAVMSVADEPGWRAGKYTVEVPGGQGAGEGGRNILGPETGP